MLMWDSDKFMTESEFLYACESTVAEKDFETLKASLLIPVQGALIPITCGFSQSGVSAFDWMDTANSSNAKAKKDFAEVLIMQ